MFDVVRTLPGLMNELAVGPDVREAVVFAVWRNAAGEQLAGQTAPLKVDDKRLIVAVSSKTWQRNLEDLSGQIIYKLNSVLGSLTIEFIEFRIDEKAVSHSRKRSNAEKMPIEIFEEMAAGEVSPELKESAERIGDPELRRRFLAAAGAALLLRKQRSNR
ncbi:MAG: DUF721 domain-containing protein [Blastocatellia bacterium]